MLNEFSRTQLLLGPDAMEKLARSRVAVFGIGGVGGYAVEALVRSGIGALDLIDDDKVCLTNINRQILATRRNVGKYKVDMAAERIREINPHCEVRSYKTFYLPETAEEFDFSQYDYVVDAIDTVSGKIQLVLAAQAAGTPIISSMGAGNKMDATAFRVADITQTSVCPLARVMRRELKKRGVQHLKVVYSKEKPIRPLEDLSISCRAHCICPPGTKRHCTDRRDIPGSVAFVPSVGWLPPDWLPLLSGPFGAGVGVGFGARTSPSIAVCSSAATSSILAGSMSAAFNSAFALSMVSLISAHDAGV